MKPETLALRKKAMTEEAAPWIQRVHEVAVFRCARCGRKIVLDLPKDKAFEERARTFMAIHGKCEDKAAAWRVGT